VEVEEGMDLAEATDLRKAVTRVKGMKLLLIRDDVSCMEFLWKRGEVSRWSSFGLRGRFEISVGGANNGFRVFSRNDNVILSRNDLS
jgi:hypothetical protein